MAAREGKVKVVRRWFPSALHIQGMTLPPQSVELEEAGHHSKEVSLPSRHHTCVKCQILAYCQWPETLIEFHLVFHALLLTLGSFKGLCFCLTL